MIPTDNICLPCVCLQIVPMRHVLRFRVTTAGGASVRQQPSHSSEELRHVAVGDTVDVSEKLFSEDCERWLRLADSSGYIWWANATNDVVGLSVVGLAPSS